MKHLKKFFAAAVALFMAIAVVTPAFAQEVASGKGGSGTITIQNSSKGIKYTVTKVFDATYNETTKTVAYTYDGTLPTNDYFAQDAQTGAITIKDAGKDATTGKLTTAAAEWLRGNVTGTVVVNEVENTDGAAMVISGLQYGYYLISSDLGTGSALSVDTNAPNATMYDKNTNTPHFDPDPDPDNPDDFEQGKRVNDSDVMIGQTVTYTIDFTATNFTGSGDTAKKVYAYKIVDTLPNFLSNVTVTSVDVDGTAITVKNAEGEDVAPQFDANKAIVVDWVDADGNSKYENNAVLTITYTATVNSSAAIAGSGNTNTVTISPLDENGNGHTDENGDPISISDSETVYTYALAFKKVDEKGTALAGAVFQVPFAVTAAGAEGEYFVDANAQDQTGTVTTPASGVVLIKGVASGTYSITETEAPAGFNKLAAPFNVTATVTNQTTTSVTKYIDADGNVTDTQTDVVVDYQNEAVAADVQFVVNMSGVALPSTGGIGTTLFYVIGGLMVAGAAIALVVKNRVAKIEK